MGKGLHLGPWPLAIHAFLHILVAGALSLAPIHRVFQDAEDDVGPSFIFPRNVLRYMGLLLNRAQEVLVLMRYELFLGDN